MVGRSTSYLGGPGLHSGLGGLLYSMNRFMDPLKSLQATGSTGTLGLLNAHGFSFTTYQNLTLPLGIHK